MAPSTPPHPFIKPMRQQHCPGVASYSWTNRGLHEPTRSGQRHGVYGTARPDRGDATILAIPRGRASPQWPAEQSYVDQYGIHSTTSIHTNIRNNKAMSSPRNPLCLFGGAHTGGFATCTPPSPFCLHIRADALVLCAPCSMLGDTRGTLSISCLDCVFWSSGVLSWGLHWLLVCPFAVLIVSRTDSAG